MSTKLTSKDRFHTFISNIKIQNFKSFKNLDISLDRYNVIIGANASGKSNFTQIFKFLNDIVFHGLSNALSMQGGAEYVQNFNTHLSENLSFDLTFSVPTKSHPEAFLALLNIPYVFVINKARYIFELQLRKSSNFKIINDSWSLDVDAYNRNDKKLSTKLSSGQIIIQKNGKNLKFDSNFSPAISFTKKNILYPYNKLSEPKSLLIENPLLPFAGIGFNAFIRQTKIYEINPKIAKPATQIKGKVELEDDGSNLSIALRNVLKNKQSRIRFFNLINDLLPFVDSINTKMVADKSVLFLLTEHYFDHRSLPSTLLSDGTVNIAALILVLYFERHTLTIIEEPERNIHPSLISRVVEMMKEASSRNQIIVTTHNPEMVRHTKVENILLIRRNKNGNSEIIKPGDQVEIKNFFENNMDITELYVQNLLGD